MSNNKRQKAEGGRRKAAGESATSCERRLLPSAFCLLLIAFCLVFSGCRQDMQDQPRYEVYESSKQFKDGLSSRPLVEGTVPRGYLKADTQLYTGKMSNAQAGGSQTGGNANANQGSQEANAGEANAAANANTNQPTAGNASATAQAGTSSGAASQAKAGADDDAADFPFAVTAEVITRGQERYRIFCAMCHGETGQGDGMIVRRGFRQPPSYHEDRLRQARVGYFFRVMTEGYGAMPPYRAQVPVQDRWAIAAYIRALQLSQMNQQLAPAHGAEAQPATGGHR
jgi:mono/diheme cytochrome c family protein